MTHMTPREEIGYGLDALVIFRSLQQDPVLRALMQFCHTDKENTPAQIRLCIQYAGHHSASVSAAPLTGKTFPAIMHRAYISPQSQPTRWPSLTSTLSSVPVPAKPFRRTWKPACTQN